MTTNIELFENPEYQERAPFYRMYRDLYDGNHATLKSSEYLWVHELEDGNTAAAGKLREIRQRRTRYTNMIEPIISRYVSLFFKKDPVLDKATESLFKEYGNDVTGTGKSFISFIKEDVTPALLLYGRPVVLTDTTPTQYANLAEQKQANAAPFFELINVLDLKDWELDSRGGFKFLRYEYTLIEPRASAQEAPKKRIYSKEFVQKGGSYIVTKYKGQPKAASQVVNGLADQTEKARIAEQKQYSSAYDWTQEGPSRVIKGQIPVRSMEGQESWIKDTAQQALKLFNLESSRDSIHYYQAHQRIFIKGVTNEDQKKALAEYTIGFLPADGDVITIEPVTTTSIDDNIARTKEAIYQGAFNQTRQVASNSKQVESANTMQEGKEQLVALIQSEIEGLENLANAIIKDYAAAVGKEKFEGKVEFCSDVTIDDIDAQLNLYMQLRGDIVKYPKWQKATLKKLAQYQRLEELSDIVEEIESISTKQPTQGTSEPDLLSNALNVTA